MEFYESEATILTDAKPRSILLLKIHKTHIGQHHRSIFALLYVKCLWFKHIGLWDTYIARFSLIIYKHSLFYSLGHGATIVTSDTIVAPDWHLCQTIVQYDVTIVQHDVTIVAQWHWTICYNIVWSMWFLARNMLHYWWSCDWELTNELDLWTFDI